MVVCVVSAFYRIPSKFSIERYIQWMEPFFTQTSFYLVLFTEMELLPMFAHWRAKWKHRTILVGLPFQEFGALTKWGGEHLWLHARSQDHEASHTPELYCMWYEKKEFVLRAIKMGAFGADKFIWCDSGILRYADWLPMIQTFPREEKIEAGKMTLLRVADFAEGDGVATNFQHVNRVGGGIQAADAATWQWWSDAYDEMMRYYISTGRFVGKDQSMMASMCLKYPEKVRMIEPPEEMDGVMKWFYLLLWLS